jgi:hypothetical protein
MIIVGVRNFGGTDQVPGLFHVQTRFFHFDFIPLVPLGSYLMIDVRSMNDARRKRLAIEIPVSIKSIAVAWVRFLATAAMIGAFVWFVIGVSHPEPVLVDCLASFGTWAVTTAIAAYLMWGRWTRYATYQRATEIVSQLQPGTRAALQRLVDRHFQQAGAFVTVPCEAIDEEAFEDELMLEHNGESALPLAVQVDLELAESPSSVPKQLPSENVVAVIEPPQVVGKPRFVALS